MAEWPESIRFDPDDRSTWPGNEQQILLVAAGRFELADFHHNVEWLADPRQVGDRPYWWLERTSDWVAAKSGSPWWPLPPTAAWADGETREHQRKAET